MHGLEEISEKTYNGYFVDLFVRMSNAVAVRGVTDALRPLLTECAQINMYKKFGYSVYRQVIGYYSGHQPEDAYGDLTRFATRFTAVDFCSPTDMRLALPRDTKKESIVPLDPLQGGWPADTNIVGSRPLLLVGDRVCGHV